MDDNNNGATNSTSASAPIASNESVHQSSLHLNPPVPPPQPPDPGDPD